MHIPKFISCEDNQLCWVFFPMLFVISPCFVFPFFACYLVDYIHFFIGYFVVQVGSNNTKKDIIEKLLFFRDINLLRLTFYTLLTFGTTY